MGKAKPVVLESRTFSTTKEAIEFVQTNILYAYKLEEVVSDPELHQILLELIARHPDREVKERGGIKEFFIRQTNKGDFKYVKNDARGIWIRRPDLTVEDFSFHTAIKKPSEWANRAEALRISINLKRIAWRENRISTGGAHCDVTGEVITDWNQAEVRYANPSWVELVDGFIAERGAVKQHSGKGKIAIGGQLEPEDAVAWHQYWEKHARPLLVLKPKGLSGARTG